MGGSHVESIRKMTVTSPPKTSIGSFIAEQVVDLANSLNKNHILDEISLSGLSDKDGSATITFEWQGDDNVLAKNILEFVHEIRNAVINTGKEVKEQISPAITKIYEIQRVLYRFRVWNFDGQYEVFEKELSRE